MRALVAFAIFGWAVMLSAWPQVAIGVIVLVLVMRAARGGAHR